MVARTLQREALAMIEGADSRILATARDVTTLLRAHRIDGAIVGGVAVVLHKYLRTTSDVDVYVGGDPQELVGPLRSEGFTFDRGRREWVRGGIPVHIVTPEQIDIPPARLRTIDLVQTVSLSDLITMKLRSGSGSILRAIDLADVIGLIRVHKLGGDFAARVHKSVRAEFRKLARAVREDRLR